MRQTLSLIALILALLGTIHGEEKPVAERASSSGSVTRSYLSQGWLIQETPAFRVICRPELTDAKRLPGTCEALRRQLQETWLGQNDESWSPRCVVVVHPTVAGYVRELGSESRQSSGCTSIELDHGEVVKRRIDLRADANDWLSTALPHELAHVVLAGKFADRKIPRWVDEGLAILAEPVTRQAARRLAMQRALASAPRYGAAELMSQREYPTGTRRDAFYGQSASLVSYLMERNTPEKFIDFVHLGQKQGYERALTEIYQIGSLAELDSRWQPQLLEHGESAVLFAVRMARITTYGRMND